MGRSTLRTVENSSRKKASKGVVSGSTRALLTLLENTRLKAFFVQPVIPRRAVHEPI